MHSVGIMRELLGAPTKLAAKDLRKVRSRAQRIGDACNFNAGWHMAAPGKKLPGSAATEKRLFADLRSVTDFLRTSAKPPKRPKAGRPAGSMKSIDDSYIHVITNHLNSHKTLAECVRAAAQKDLIDRNTADTTHIRRVERYYAMVRMKFADPQFDK